MTVSSMRQMNVLFVSVAVGALCALLFDLQRFFRKKHRTGELLTGIEDFAYALIITFAVIYSGYVCNNGKVRYYQLLGALSGAAVYAVLFSRAANAVFELVFRVVCAVVLKPLALLVCAALRMWEKIFALARKFIRKIEKRAKACVKMLKTGAKSLKKSIKLL